MKGNKNHQYGIKGDKNASWIDKQKDIESKKR